MAISFLNTGRTRARQYYKETVNVNNLERIMLLDAFYRFAYEAKRHGFAAEEIRQIEEKLVEWGLVKRD